MIYYDVKNIRELFGSKVSIQSTKNNPVCYIQSDMKQPTVTALN